MTEPATLRDMDALLAQWTQDPTGAKGAFLLYRQWLETQPQVRLEFIARPGVSYSLRAVHARQQERPLFVLIDVVDDEPMARWLSICFYADMITDPEELGDFVPEGLLGRDACCLNLDENDAKMRDYIFSRLQEAAAAAATQA